MFTHIQLILKTGDVDEMFTFYRMHGETVFADADPFQNY